MNSRRGFLANIAGAGLSIPLINKVTPASALEIKEYGKPSLKLKPSEDEKYTYIRVRKCQYLDEQLFLPSVPNLDWQIINMNMSGSQTHSLALSIELVGTYNQDKI